MKRFTIAKPELWKSFLLLTLIVTSIVQTIILWDYHPTYQAVQSETQLTTVDESLQRRANQVIIPVQTVVHDNNAVFASKNTPKQLMRVIRDSFEASEFKPLAAKNVPNFYTDINEGLELILPEAYYADTLSYMLPGTYSLSGKIPQRILIYMDNSAFNIRAIMSDQSIWEGKLTKVGNGDVNSLFLKNSSRTMKRVTYTDERVNYIPVVGPEMNELFAYDVSSIQLDARLDWMRETFFPGDPNVQEVDPASSVGALTNGVSVVEYDATLNASRYRNLSRNSTERDVALGLDSIVEFVNFHGGWVDDSSEGQGLSLRFDAITPANKGFETSVFRFHVRGYPVFSQREAFINNDAIDLSTLRVENDGAQVRSITRHHLEIDRLITVGTTQLADANEVLGTLINSGRFENVTEIRIGYEIEYNEDTSRFVTFSPNWFVREAGRWVPYNQAEGWTERMMYRGLE
ncbi:two-component system activity regulator YycH [Exiguobacterium qingdaonense]|uniref:two-component system activity regulator YycH n=1 Tax=Exiguobacterium qingdaonense TaxID=2751251 RepID=UPI001BE7018D|nr:two-component system activity regulator YycH [Exiguobacterium qingdaonense]